ncbi:MAG: methyltransferase domain-containing protein [Alphaproteobacteria bacterium]|nr:methyltransferase domain-containing protein [Alphaproteobacteria bacterium]MBT4020651.1 methyltransferase domain-containing protein [Alphaproteobacteria bacterium]MBT4965334.1 methyltransferase domain-containing protein [Alphaproteobacteria bacterium]MBT5161362.1 methyltransferase domain-containing protein [Alphaproteobacteria bacterium]MBT5918486.1 methyltransferase domain-containing protein [Alphaproteobacteria bacterium]
MTWDPDRYLHFGGQRVRPALDLMSRIPLSAPGHIVDLGCGAGNVTRLLSEYWPRSSITGVDNSPEMLTRAFAEGLDVTWVEADINTWQPEIAPDLIFSNAALHWCDSHQTLLPDLIGQLGPQGVLAVQMPRNHSAPSHVCMIEAAKDGPWYEKLELVLRPGPVATPEKYYQILSTCSWKVDIWEAEYLQILDGENPVVEWTSTTALQPLLEALEDEDERAGFLQAYSDRIAEAYPVMANGKTLFPFRRIFIIAQT